MADDQDGLHKENTAQILAWTGLKGSQQACKESSGLQPPESENLPPSLKSLLATCSLTDVQPMSSICLLARGQESPSGLNPFPSSG